MTQIQPPFTDTAEAITSHCTPSDRGESPQLRIRMTFSGTKLEEQSFHLGTKLLSGATN